MQLITFNSPNMIRLQHIGQLELTADRVHEILPNQDRLGAGAPSLPLNNELRLPTAIGGGWGTLNCVAVNPQHL